MSKVLPTPRFAITTTTACDANVNTFRLASEIYGIESFVLDIPYEYSKDGEEYVKEQLKEMVTFIEDNLKEKLNEDKLREIILTENKTIEYHEKYLNLLKNKYFPNTVTSEMFKVFTTHSRDGKKKILLSFMKCY